MHIPLPPSSNALLPKGWHKTRDENTVWEGSEHRPTLKRASCYSLLVACERSHAHDLFHLVAVASIHCAAAQLANVG